ncbi:MAG: GntR family transcriptional regulator [Lachnospiraceae bacterium]|nr:GntR family transcriptional regulator [Lachnospiraceae bacterium]
MIILDYRDSRPIYEQVVEKFKLLILKGVLAQDEKMPSVRNLAMELSINPNTIQRAYATLESQGYIYTVKGKGNFVSDKATLMKDYQKEISSQLNEVCKQAASAGMGREEFMALVKESVAATGEWRNL